MVTIKDVAKMAGVSTATVSMVLNKKDSISQSTAAKVMKCVEELGYRPNLIARGFKTANTRVIAVLVPTITNPIYPAFVNAIEIAARAVNYQVVLYSYKGDSTQGSGSDFLADFYDRMIDGLIICGIPNLPDTPQGIQEMAKMMQLYSERGVPFVFFSDVEQFDFFTKTLKIDLSKHYDLFHLLSVDRVSAVYKVIYHFLSLDHKRIAFVTEGEKDSYPHNIPNLRKLEGYKKALHEFGISFDEDLVVNGLDGFTGGEQCYNILSNLENPPTAYFCTGDTMALGVLHGARVSGKRIPEEVTVIGYDNIPFAQYWNPSLSTISVPVADIATESFRRLYSQINKNVIATTNRMIFNTELIIRESSN